MLKAKPVSEVTTRYLPKLISKDAQHVLRASLQLMLSLSPGSSTQICTVIEIFLGILSALHQTHIRKFSLTKKSVYCLIILPQLWRCRFLCSFYSGISMSNNNMIMTLLWSHCTEYWAPCTQALHACPKKIPCGEKRFWGTPELTLSKAVYELWDTNENCWISINW